MRKLLLIAILFVTSMSGWAQGVTTASISGIVKDQKGEALPGSTVVAVHTPSGSQYGTLTRTDGRFTIPNARVGGPYKITITFIGYEQQEKNDVYLSLGNTTEVNFQLVETGVQLQEVVVVGSSDNLMSQERTGASTNINSTTINSVPNIGRGLRDFTKLSPLANTSGSGTSFAGASNRYNQFAIDGLVTNDVFGLSSSGTNGGQANIEPISLDAIEEFQLSIAPYDVRQGGFTGGGINAVTRSGSNKFQGSAYYYGNNQNLVSNNNPNTSESKKYPEYKDFQEGLRLGGPIIKNKLFFFVSGEITRKKTPLAYQPGTAASLITTDEIDRVLTTLKSIAPDYDPGAWQSLSNETNSKKLLAKIDWNISTNHKLTVRHSYTYGEDISNSRTNSALRFANTGIYFPSTTNSTAIELNSTFGSKYSNRLLIGRTSVRDHRKPLGDPFPYTLINLEDAPTGRTIIFGSENSSVANQLNQDITSVTDDFNMYLGKHTVTLGTNNEIYKFYNLFVQNIYGNYAFKTLANFESQATQTPVAPTYYQIGYSFDPTDNPSQSKGAASFKALQLGLYAQDDYQLNDRIKIIAGLRADLPIFPDKPTGNSDFNTAYSSFGSTGVVPKSRVLWSPRVGFNVDVFGDKSLQVRGGTGVFTGRVPFVWVSNQYSNNGQLNGTYRTGSTASNANPLGNVTYSVNPANQPTAEDLGATAAKGDINVIDKSFKFPQVFRTNLAVDKQLPWGLVGTLEFILSKTYNNINFTNINRNIDTLNFRGPDHRPHFATGNTDPTYNDVIKLSNTNKGYAINYVAQLQKQFKKGFSGSIAYSYGNSKDLNSGTSSVASSNWKFVNNVNGLNSLPITRSNYSAASRIVGLVSYRKAYLNEHASTQISLYYNGQSGQPISYIYSNDFNNDGTANDLIYVPKNASEINLISYTKKDSEGNTITVTPEEQWASLDGFISNNKYLKDRRGKYAERNASRMPFQHQFDLRIIQEFSVKAGNSNNKLQFSLDIINIGNLLKDSWGRQYTASNQQFGLITAGKIVDGNRPTYTYSPSLTNDRAWSASDLASRWRMQFGIRYLFN